MGHTRGTQWSDEKIKGGIIEVVKKYKLDRMPSRKEIEQYYNDSKLTNAISKRKGYYQYAAELGLKIKQSDTYFGKSQERICAEQLKSLGYEVRQMPQNFPYDLLVNDCVKIDVKTARLYTGKLGNFYSFNLEKPYCTCDIYLLYLLEDDCETIKDIIVLPSKFVPTNTQISIGECTSKYYKYSGKWDYIQQYTEFYENVS